MTFEDTLRDYNYRNGFSVPSIYTSTRILTLTGRAVDDYFSLLYSIYIYDLYTAKGIRVIDVMITENIYMHMHIQPLEYKGNKN